MVNWIGLQANCLHEAVHIAVAKRFGIVVTSADITEEIVNGQKMVKGVDLGPCKKTDDLALYYFAPSVYDRENLKMPSELVYNASSEDFKNFEAVVVALDYPIEEARSRFTICARRVLAEPRVMKAIASYADALEKHKRLEQPDIDRIWDEIVE